MDLDEIRQIIEIDGGKFIIVEDGKPIMVVTSFEEYKKRLTEKKNNPGRKPTVHAQEQRPVPKELREEELKLEDLPL